MDLGHQILIVSTYILAVMRITRLINGDTIFDKFRLIPANRAHEARKAAAEAKRDNQPMTQELNERSSRRWSTFFYFLECPWCVGMWVCFATAWLPMYFSNVLVVQYIGIALAASHLIGVFAFAADTEEVEIEESTD